MQQTWVARDRVSLMGWANGASALLWAVRPQSAARNAGPDFRSAIAFYPDCRISAGLGWSARVPTLVLIGAKDDVSSPPACRQMVDGARGRSALARIVVYPGAYHDFDRANLPLHAIGGGTDAGLAGARPCRHRHRSARGFAKARRGVAGAVSCFLAPPCGRGNRGAGPQQQIALGHGFAARLGACGLALAGVRLVGRATAGRPICRGRDAAVGKFDRSMRAPVRSRPRHARHGPDRSRTSAKPRASTPRYDNAASNWPLWATRASSRCIAVTSARRARSARRCVRSRSRAIALRCACALESFDAFSLTSSPAKRSRRCRSSERAESDPLAAHGQPLPACATCPCSTRNVRPALVARTGGNAHGYWPSIRGAGEVTALSSRWRGIASRSSREGSARAAARNSLRRLSWPRCQHSHRCAARGSRPRPAIRLRTGTAISAAAVGVGARMSATKSISVMSVSWPTAEISGIMLGGRGAHHDLVVEAQRSSRCRRRAPRSARRAAGSRRRAGSALKPRMAAATSARPRLRPARAPARPARGAESGRRGGAGCRG